MRVRWSKTAAVAAVVAAAGMLAGCVPVAAPPVGRPAIRLAPNAPSVFDNADPGVLVDGTLTYLFGTTNNKKLPVRRISSFTAPISESQTAWAQHPVDAMPSRPAWVDPAEWEIWAPSLTKLGGKFWVYFAAHNRAATTDEHNDLCIGRASATAPAGPYTPEATPIYCGLAPEGAIAGQPPSNRFGRGALDPTFFRGADGTPYLVVSLSRTNANIGVVRLQSDGKVAGGLNAKPAVLATASLSWHDGAENSTRPLSFLENPAMVYEPKSRTYLLFYSAGKWDTDAYNTGFARCASPTGPCRLDTRAPFLKGGNGRSGPGGLTTFTDRNGIMKVAYHSWTPGHEGEIGNVGQYKRKTHWADLVISGSDPATQTITLR